MTATNVAASMTGCAGQRCMAASAMLAVGNVDPIIDQICEEARKIVPGKISEQSFQKTRRNGSRTIFPKPNVTVQKSWSTAAVPTVDGKENGTYVGPTVIDHVTPEMSVAREEIFGPGHFDNSHEHAWTKRSRSKTRIHMEMPLPCSRRAADSPGKSSNMQVPEWSA